MSIKPIVTNRLRAEIDYDKLDNDFSIYKVSKDRLFDLAKNCCIESCYYHFVLVKNENENKLINYAELKKLEVEKIHWKDLNKYSILKVLFNALQKVTGPGYSECSGRLFYCDEKSIHNYTCKQILAQEVNLDYNLSIWLSTVTFTAYNSLNDKGKKKAEKKVPYIVHDCNQFSDYNLARYDGALDDNIPENLIDDIYVIYQPFDSPSEPRTFFSTLAKPNQKQNYETCRCHLLYKIVDMFNGEYKDIVTLSFEETGNIPEFLNTFSMEDGKRKGKELYYETTAKMIEKFVRENRFNIMYDVENIQHAQLLEEKFISLYPYVSITRNEPLDDSSVHLYVLHDKEYYKEAKIPDPYLKYFKTEIVVQNVTIELLKKNINNDKFAKAFFEKILIECIIKNDIIEKNISFLEPEMKEDFDANYLRFISQIKYVSDDEKTQKEIKKYRFYMMTIYLDTEQVEYDVFEDINDIPYEIYEPLVDLIDEAHLENGTKYVVEDDCRAYKIEETHMFPLPDDKEVMEAIKEGASSGVLPKFRNKKNSLVITNLLDLKMFSNRDQYGNDVIYYFTGLMGSDLRSESIPKAPRIRKVVGVNVFDLFRKYRTFLEVNFITTNNRFTVYPFPFKYLNEFQRKKENEEQIVTVKDA